MTSIGPGSRQRLAGRGGRYFPARYFDRDIVRRNQSRYPMPVPEEKQIQARVRRLRQSWRFDRADELVRENRGRFPA